MKINQKLGIIIVGLVSLILSFVIISLQSRGFWSDLKQWGFKDSVTILSESFSCVQEGAVLSSTLNYERKLCCKELTKISLDKPSSDANSVNGCTVGSIGGLVCTNCGNGICGLGENKCNCPVDCINHK